MLDKCRKGLHSADMTNEQGKCHGCKILRQRLYRHARNGNPLCWTGKHPEPRGGLICRCGEQPDMDETSVDWAIVERASHDQDLPRHLTTAEAIATVRTLQRRLRGSDYDVVSWAGGNREEGDGEADSFWPGVLGDTRRARYLVYEAAHWYRHISDAVAHMDRDYAPEDPAEYPERYPRRAA